MTGDVCACGRCDVDACDLCGSPVAFVDDEGEAWCRACHDNYTQMRRRLAGRRGDSAADAGGGAMTIREQVAGYQAEMLHDLAPVRAREILVHLTALYGYCLKEVREADHAYAVVLLRFLDADEAASRAKIRAETSLEYLRKREADDTTEIVLESMRSLKAMLRSVEEEMRLAR